MTTDIFIPQLCQVGFQQRNDTYTKKLGYIIYRDEKNKLRKETSFLNWIVKYTEGEEYENYKFQSWQSLLSTEKTLYRNGEYHLKNFYRHYHQCDIDELRRRLALPFEEYILAKLGKYDDYKPNGNYSNDPSFKVLEFKNIPTEGFVLNKKVGDYKSDWNHRQGYCRVFDPRGFEFEITFENLLYILSHTNSLIGKGLDGKFVYGWSGPDLVLIPEASTDFNKYKEYTDLRNSNDIKKLVVGGKYIFLDHLEYIYLGYEMTNESRGYRSPNTYKKKHIFYCNKSKSLDVYTSIPHTKIKVFVEIDSNIEKLLEEFFINVTNDLAKFKLITEDQQIINNIIASGDNYKYYDKVFVQTAIYKFDKGFPVTSSHCYMTNDGKFYAKCNRSYSYRSELSEPIEVFDKGYYYKQTK